MNEFDKYENYGILNRDWFDRLLDQALQRDFKFIIRENPNTAGLIEAINGLSGKRLAYRSPTDDVILYEDDETFWSIYEEGSGMFDIISLTEETTIVKSGMSSLEVTVNEFGSHEKAGCEHTFGSDQDWSNKDWLCFWLYPTTGFYLYVRLIDSLNNWREWNFSIVTSYCDKWIPRSINLSSGDSESETPIDLTKVRTVRIYGADTIAALFYVDKLYLGTDEAGYVINQALSNLSVGRTSKEKVLVIGKLPLISTLAMPSNSALEIWGQLKPEDEFFADGLIWVGSGIKNVEIFHGTLSGHDLMAFHGVLCYEAEQVCVHNLRLKDFEAVYAGSMLISSSCNKVQFIDNRLIGSDTTNVLGINISNSTETIARGNLLYHLARAFEGGSDNGLWQGNLAIGRGIGDWCLHGGIHNWNKWSDNIFLDFAYCFQWVSGTNNKLIDNTFKNCGHGYASAPIVQVTPDKSMIRGNEITIEGGSVAKYALQIGNDTDVFDNRLDAGTEGVIKYVGKTGFKIRNNRGFNPFGIVANPFETTSGTIGLLGDEVDPTANTDYTVIGVDIFITCNGGTGVSITIKDQNGATVASGLNALTQSFLPIAYKINFGNFSVAPTTMYVSGN